MKKMCAFDKTRPCTKECSSRCYKVQVIKSYCMAFGKTQPPTVQESKVYPFCQRGNFYIMEEQDAT